MNPDLNLDDLDAVLQCKIEEHNNRPNPKFCGLSPSQMEALLYSPFDSSIGMTITVPDDLSSSPVMCYLALMLEEAERGGGSFKATTKGNLPTKLVKQASELLPGFAISKFETVVSVSDFAGANEDKFNALHYTRLLAEIAGIIYRRSGRYHVKKSAQKLYQKQGLQAFFKPLLEAAVMKYNWGYLDGWPSDVELRIFWRFMLWRLHSHASGDLLVQDMLRAFPDLLETFESDGYFSQEVMLGNLIQLRFVERFLRFWGFVLTDSKYHLSDEHEPNSVELTSLFAQTFQFDL